MKHLFFILTAFMALSLMVAACGKKKTASEQATPQETKTLVAYFSATGTTAKVAKTLAEAIHADLYEIKAQQPYTEADLDWRNEQSRSSVEMKDKNSRPAIADTIRNIAHYNTIFLGFPVWWYTAPTIINTFLETYDLTGKTIIPFATSGGSDITNVHEELKVSAPHARWLQGKLLNGNPSAENLTEWIKYLALEP